MKRNIMISGTGGQGIVASGSFLSNALFMKDSDPVTLVNRKTGKTIETTWGDLKKGPSYLVDIIRELEAEEAEK